MTQITPWPTINISRLVFSMRTTSNTFIVDRTRWFFYFDWGGLLLCRSGVCLNWYVVIGTFGDQSRIITLDYAFITVSLAYLPQTLSLPTSPYKLTPPFVAPFFSCSHTGNLFGVVWSRFVLRKGRIITFSFLRYWFCSNLLDFLVVQFRSSQFFTRGSSYALFAFVALYSLITISFSNLIFSLIWVEVTY